MPETASPQPRELFNPSPRAPHPATAATERIPHEGTIPPGSDSSVIDDAPQQSEYCAQPGLDRPLNPSMAHSQVLTGKKHHRPPLWVVLAEMRLITH